MNTLERQSPFDRDVYLHREDLSHIAEEFIDSAMTIEENTETAFHPREFRAVVEEDGYDVTHLEAIELMTCVSRERFNQPAEYEAIQVAIECYNSETGTVNRAQFDAMMRRYGWNNVPDYVVEDAEKTINDNYVQEEEHDE